MSVCVTGLKYSDGTIDEVDVWAIDIASDWSIWIIIGLA